MPHLLATAAPLSPFCRTQLARRRGQPAEGPAPRCVLKPGSSQLAWKLHHTAKPATLIFKLENMVPAPQPSLKLGTALPLPPVGARPGPLQSQLTKLTVDRKKKSMPGLGPDPRSGARWEKTGRAGRSYPRAQAPHHPPPNRKIDA